MAQRQAGRMKLQPTAAAPDSEEPLFIKTNTCSLRKFGKIQESLRKKNHSHNLIKITTVILITQYCVLYFE